MAGNNDESQLEQQRTINMLVEKQKVLEVKVERLESLEHANAANVGGCISWVDSDEGSKASFRVDIPFTVLPELFPYLQATLFWQFNSSAAQCNTPLYMRINNLSDSLYNWSYSYSEGGGAVVPGWANWQDEWQVAEIVADGFYNMPSVGIIHIPYVSYSKHTGAFGEWTKWEGNEGCASLEQRGNWGGHHYGSTRPIRFDFFAGAGNLRGRVDLYGWCLPNTGGWTPPD